MRNMCKGNERIIVDRLKVRGKEKLKKKEQKQD